MPSPADILAGLSVIANRAVGVAVAWHIAATAVLIALTLGWRPSQPAARTLLVLPLVSVAVLAVLFGNPFNGVVFGAGSVALVVLARWGRHGPVQRGASWTWWAGVASLGFGWMYPHFLRAHPAAFLIAAPFGLLPCPTLAVVIGAAVLGGSLGSRAWCLVLAALGALYGAYGVVRLGVFLDAGLLIGAGTLFIATLRSPREIQNAPFR